MISKFTLVCIPLFTMVTIQFLNRTTLSQTVSEELTGHFRAMVLNATSWRQYDCLVRVERFEEHPDKSIISSVGHTRFVMDWDRGEGLCVSEVVGTQIVEGVEVKKKNVLRGVVSNGERLAQFTFPKLPRESKVSSESKVSLRSVLRDFGVGDLRGIGLTQYPLLFNGEKQIGSFETFMLIATPGPRGQVKQLDKKLLLKLESSVVGHDMEVIQDFIIDKATMVTEEWKRTIRIPSGANGKNYPDGKQQIKWKEIDDCFVPVELIDSRDVFDRNSLKSFAKPQFVNIHWLSLNEPLDERFFEISILENLQELRNLVDPKWAGATSLLESK